MAGQEDRRLEGLADTLQDKEANLEEWQKSLEEWERVESEGEPGDEYL
jgi:hypothetical protein